MRLANDHIFQVGDHPVIVLPRKRRPLDNRIRQRPRQPTRPRIVTDQPLAVPQKPVLIPLTVSDAADPRLPVPARHGRERHIRRRGAVGIQHHLRLLHAGRPDVKNRVVAVHRRAQRKRAQRRQVQQKIPARWFAPPKPRPRQRRQRVPIPQLEPVIHEITVYRRQGRAPDIERPVLLGAIPRHRRPPRRRPVVVPHGDRSQIETKRPQFERKRLTALRRARADIKPIMPDAVGFDLMVVTGGKNHPAQQQAAQGNRTPLCDNRHHGSPASERPTSNHTPHPASSRTPTARTPPPRPNHLGDPPGRSGGSG